MSMVPLENLEPGMVLAANVLDRSGRLLLGEGVELQAKHLFVFRTWGVVEADIVGAGGTDSTALPENITQEELDQARNALLHFYCHTDIEHPAICELLRLAVIRKVKHDQH
ncbi:MAG: hypothetical protein PHI31_06725 [Desulfuromonadaceae bacterium]|nr:hypothetical protein [Desulfuromonadaceae bacterium]